MAAPTRHDDDRDEGPSDEDLARFGDETGFCPDCGARVWDQADVCPVCFAYIGGETSRRPRAVSAHRRIVVTLVVIALLLSALWLGLSMRGLR
jgi:hypothetical protein